MRNASGVVSEIAQYFDYSPKRQRFFEHVIESVSPAAKKSKLKDLCRTHWVERIDSYLVFYDLYPAIVKAMESISECSSEYGEWSWDSKSITKANGYIHQLASSEFIVTFLTTMRILSSLRCLTINLQKKVNDILAAYDHVSDVQMEFELLRVNCEEEFHSWFAEIKEFAEKQNTPIRAPRIVSRQVHRDNIPADTPEAYYRRNLLLPFLDHICSEMQARFGPIHQTKIKLLGLIPSLAEKCSSESVKQVGELYKDDLPSPHLLSTEFSRWKMKFQSVPSHKRPSIIAML
ncbi:MAG: hypothetical protein A6F71_09870 [Cycloclasticus sp. symbiont of Poecilosclerida sp. M]|nr:MAG: hypothetical protein A6F71_09870 [Cycloclasticus sp. symbiont of Poecilosclerida sp. M]